MIDLHSHVLPGIDDGARTLDESVEMLRIAAAAGTTDLVATPHANIQYPFDPAVVEAKIAEVSAAAGHVVRLHYGCDFHFYYENIQDALENPAKYAIAHKNYLLVEFPDILISNSTDEIFSRLLQSGIAPVVTHPERNYLLHARLRQIEAWVAGGVLMQVTGQSLLGRFGADVRRFADELMRGGLVHFIASDAHDPEDRPPRLDVAFDYVSKKYGKAWAEMLFNVNPRLALNGKPLPQQPPRPVARKWYQFWHKG